MAINLNPTTDEEAQEAGRALLMEQQALAAKTFASNVEHNYFSDDGFDEIVGLCWLIEKCALIAYEGTVADLQELLDTFADEASSDAWCATLSHYDDVREGD